MCDASLDAPAVKTLRLAVQVVLVIRAEELGLVPITTRRHTRHWA